VYLSRAYGSWAGFLFGWAQLAVLLTASIGVMAFVFADYTVRLWKPFADWEVLFAVAAVVVLSLINILGVVLGKWTQNLLTAVKVLGLGGIVAAGVCWGQPEAWTVAAPKGETNFGFAMILILYAYGGWNDAAFVAAELRNRRHIPLALILGTVGITVIYLTVNVAYLLVLGFEGVRQSKAVAADVLSRPLGDFGEKAMCLLVMISALGAINGLILTGSRVYSSLGAEHSVFAWLGRWHPRLGSPVWSLLAQALISLAMIAAVGTEPGRQTLDELLQRIGLEPLPWKQYFGGFETLVAGTAPVFWLFFLLTGVSLFALRQRDPRINRPFSVPFYPVVPLIFCGTCLYMWYAAVSYAKNLAMIGWVPLLAGLPLYLISKRRVLSADDESGGMAVEPQTE
jgi:amino acid transporter